MVTLKSAYVQDFQSLAVASMSFDGFNVLVGPSNSGKSAFLRAVRALVRNTFVPANVRQGESRALLLIYLNGHIISAERGKSLSTYYLEDDPYPKSGKSVPEDIVKVLKMPLIEGIDPSFSFQFDRPFLLAESGATAATVIGSLTNVSVLHAAVREANRRRGEVTATLKVREKDRERLEALVESYRYLPARKDALDRAYKALQSAEITQAALDRLEAAASALEAAEGFLATFTLPEVPAIDLKPIEDDLEELRILDTLVGTIEDDLTEMRRYARLESAENESLNRLNEEYQDLLKEAGVCPTCGRPTHD